jgi:hypothetical protein
VAFPTKPRVTRLDRITWKSCILRLPSVEISANPFSSRLNLIL